MSAKKLLEALEKLVTLHKSLYELATQKTEVIKEGDIDSLNSIIKDEQKHITAILKIEKEREQEVYKIVSGHAIEGEAPTLTDCLNIVDEQDREQLQRVQQQLFSELSKIKELNQLNQQLIHQSLQFVNLSLDLFQPQQQVINYQRPDQPKKKSAETRFSAFDSKA